MAWLRHSYELKIKETDLDSFGHMNNAVYLRHLEDARWEYVTARGYGYRQVQERKMGPVILEINIQFHKELKLRQIVKIETQVMDYSGKIGRLRQEIKSEAGEVLSTAVFTMGFFDLQTRKLIPPPPEWLHAIGYLPESQERI